MANRHVGYINNLIKSKGYGFIQSDDSIIFFHASGLIEGDFEELKEGQTVTFIMAESSRGTKAIGVKTEPNQD